MDFKWGFRIISEYKVNAMFTVPTALRILREVDPEAKFGAEYDISSLRQVSIKLLPQVFNRKTFKWIE